ncbi:MAG: hypothetical protein ACFFBP_03515 [Promethearchaeota archaeon]
MKNQKKNLMFFGIVLLFLFVLVISVNLNRRHLVGNNIQNSFLPKASDSFDIIITPENKTYSKPMEGYYPATYEFENDEIGGDPAGWQTNDFGASEIDIYNSGISHQKVLRIKDNVVNDVCEAYTYFGSNIVSGTVEWWIMSSDMNARLKMELFCNNGHRFDVRLWNTKIISGPKELIYFENDTWYHMRVDFDCGTYTYDVYINGLLMLYNQTFDNMIHSIFAFRLQTDFSTLSGYCYFDALGYSTDPNYEVGDNLEEGLFFSFENREGADWMGYSLDGATNVTIKGNKTLPMITEKGAHTIQLFWSNASGNYQSKIREFYIDTYPKNMVVEILDQLFTIEEFLIKFSVKNILGVNINSANINAWWDGTLVSDQIENLGNGIYQISLSPITVPPGDPPILFRLVVSAEDYQEKLIEVYLSVDPDVINKIPDDGRNGDIIFLIITIFIAGASITSIVIVSTIGIVRSRSRKLVNKRKEL